MSRGRKGASRQTETNYESESNSRPFLSVEAEEQEMISLAVDAAKKQLIEGTASSQVITHYLKLATQKNQLELEKLREENRLLSAKTKAIESAEQTERLYREAINAMRRYGGHGSVSSEDYEEDDQDEY